MSVNISKQRVIMLSWQNFHWLHCYTLFFKPTNLNKSTEPATKNFRKTSPQASKITRTLFFLFKNRFSQEDRFAPHCAGCFAGTGAARAALVAVGVAAGRGSQLRSGAGAAGGQVHWPTDRRPAAEDAGGQIWRWREKRLCVFFFWCSIFLKNFLSQTLSLPEFLGYLGPSQSPFSVWTLDGSLQLQI